MTAHLQEIPDRMDVSDDGYPAELGRNITIKLDGIEQTKTLGYCISEGWVRRCKCRPDGTLILNEAGDEIANETLTGVVEVSIRPDPLRDPATIYENESHN